MKPFSPLQIYKRKDLVELPQDIFQGYQVIYYPGAQSDTSIIELVKAAVPSNQFKKIKFVYQDPFYSRV